MESIRFIRLLICAGALLTATSAIKFLKQGPLTVVSQDELLASNTYYGPTKPIPGKPQLVKVEVFVRDSADPAGPQVVSVEFDQKTIPLKPRDIYGNRGGASFQVPPGSYKLHWKTNQNNFSWPRNVDHEQEVAINPRDLWIQLEIEGENATIN